MLPIENAMNIDHWAAPCINGARIISFMPPALAASTTASTDA